jgi:hypothetical protein
VREFDKRAVDIEGFREPRGTLGQCKYKHLIVHKHPLQIKHKKENILVQKYNKK